MVPDVKDIKKGLAVQTFDMDFTGMEELHPP